MRSATASGSDRRASLPGPPALLLAVAYGVVLALPVVVAWIALREEPAPLRLGLQSLRFWGVALGLLGLAVLLTQFVSSGRFEFISGRAGIDRTMRAHREIGAAVLLLALAHPLLLSGPEPGESWRGTLAAAWTLAQMKPLRSGSAALVLLALLVAWAVVRRRVGPRYELWRAAHLVLGIAIAALAADHAFSIGTLSAGALKLYWAALLAAALLAVLWVHGARPLHLARRRWRVVANRPVVHGVFELELEAAHRAPKPFLAGQFGWLSTGRWPVPVTDHPFSIASAPEELPRLRLLIKQRGDGTRALAQLAPGTAAYLDYPHGHFTPDTHPWQRLLLIAGGIGVAPMFSILRALAARAETRPIDLVYGVNAEEDLVGRDELAELAQRLSLQVHLFVDRPAQDPALYPRSALLPTIGQLAAPCAGERLLAMLCGPAGMPRAVVPVLRGAGLARAQIVYERFDV